MKVVFDLDGTLIDSLPQLRAIAVEMIAETHGVPPYVADEAYVSTIGRSFSEQLEILFPRDKKNAKLVEDYELEHEEVYRYVLLHFGVVETIQWLGSQEYMLGVVSSSPTDLVRDVCSRLLPELYMAGGTVTGFDQGTKEQQLFHQFTELKPEEGLFVGDTPFDAQVSHRVGVDFRAVENTFTKRYFKDMGISSLETLPDVADYVSDRYRTEQTQASPGPSQKSVGTI